MKFCVSSTFLLAAAALLGGCGKSEDKAANKTPVERPKIALVMKSLANEFFSTMAAGASQHQKTNAVAYDLLVNGIKNETDLAEQVSLVEQMIARQVNAIVIAPADSKALVTVLKQAKAAGILIINIDNKLDPDALKQADLQVPFVGPDNCAGARNVGEVLATQLKAADQAAIIEGSPTAFNGQQRRLGFEGAMKAAGIHIVSVQSGDWEMEKANGIATALLSEYPDLKAILCANDNMALGAVAAIEAAGKTGKVLVAGFDNIGAVHSLIDKGEITATADQHGDQLAVFGIQAALKILRGQAPPADQTTPVDLITRIHPGSPDANDAARHQGSPPPQ
jgi:ribose transport system substrate-binding protein